MQVLKLIFQRDTKWNLSSIPSFQLGVIRSSGEESRSVYLTRWYSISEFSYSDKEIKQTQPNIAGKLQEKLAKPFIIIL